MSSLTRPSTTVATKRSRPSIPSINVSQAAAHSTTEPRSQTNRNPTTTQQHSTRHERPISHNQPTLQRTLTSRTNRPINTHCQASTATTTSSTTVTTTNTASTMTRGPSATLAASHLMSRGLVPQMPAGMWDDVMNLASQREESAMTPAVRSLIQQLISDRKAAIQQRTNNKTTVTENEDNLAAASPRPQSPQSTMETASTRLRRFRSKVEPAIVKRELLTARHLNDELQQYREKLIKQGALKVNEAELQPPEEKSDEKFHSATSTTILQSKGFVSSVVHPASASSRIC